MKTAEQILEWIDVRLAAIHQNREACKIILNIEYLHGKIKAFEEFREFLMENE